jgi:chemotaxis protein MotB
MASLPKIAPPALPGSASWSRRWWVVAGALLASGAASGVAYLQYQSREQAQSALIAARGTLETAQAKVAELEAQKHQLEAQKAQLEADKETLETAKAELARSVQAKEGELSQLKGTYDSFREKMKDEIARGDINLEQTGGKLRVGLVDKILFDTGEAEISKRGEGVLARLAEALAGIPDKQIQVSGHTDKLPINSKLSERYPTNWELSTARATQVVRFLTEKAGVPPQRMVASGYGEFHPIASNKTVAGRAKNRRIEILLTPLLAPRTLSKSKLLAAAEKPADKRAKPAPKSALARPALGKRPSPR